MSPLFIIYAFFFICVGVSATLLWQQFRQKGDTIELNRRDVYFDKGFRLASLIVLVFGFYYIAGFDGWIYKDFAHYQQQVNCLPNKWDFLAYPVWGDKTYYLKYENGLMTKSWELNQTNFTLPDWVSSIPNQSVPNNGDDEFYKVMRGG